MYSDENGKTAHSFQILFMRLYSRLFLRDILRILNSFLNCENIILLHTETRGDILTTVETIPLVDNTHTGKHAGNTRKGQSTPSVRLTQDDFPSLQTKKVADHPSPETSYAAVAGTGQNTHQITAPKRQQSPEILIKEDNRNLFAQDPQEI